MADVAAAIKVASKRLGDGGVGGGGGGGGDDDGPKCSPAYPDFCIPPPPPDRDCDDVNGSNFAVKPPDPHRTLVYVGAYLGLRWQEVSGLRREAITMRPNRLAALRVVTTIERSNGHCRAVEYGKSAAARRTLKMPEFLREMLAWHLGAFPSEEWVFTAPRGGFLRYDNFRRRVWAPAVRAAGLDGLTFHQLRHTGATFMIEDGADPLQIKRRMGHEDIATTYNLYGHLFEREEESVAGLDRRKLNAHQERTRQTPSLSSLTAREPLTCANREWTRGESNP